jgi:tetratricopeptide (TPR) repeat protein
LWESALVAGLFAFHPLHVESVAWISERKDVLSTLFAFCTIWFYVRYAQEGGPDSRPWRDKFYWFSIVTYALALMAKPMVVSLPLLLLLLDFWPLRRVGWAGWKRTGAGLLAEKIPLLVLSASCCVLTLVAQQKAMLPPTAASFGARVGNVAVNYLVYLRKLFWPVDLAAFYPYATRTVGQGVAAGLVLLIISFVAIRCARRWPSLFVGWFWFVVALVPVVGIIQVGGQSIADRYTYVPSVGIFVALVWLASDVVARASLRVAAFSAATVAVASFACCAYWQTGYWRNTVTLFDATLLNTTNNVFIVGGMAGALDNSGNKRAAEEYFLRAFQMNAGDARIRYNYGNFCAHNKEYEKSLPYFDAAISVIPDFADAYLSKARALVMLDRVQEAKTNYLTTLKLKPDALSAELDLAAIYISEKNFDEALKHYQRALQLSPRYPRAHYLMGICLAQMNRQREAVGHFQIAVQNEKKPDVAAYNDLAWMLAVVQDPSVHNPAEAIRLAEQACASSTNKDAGTLDTLAVAHAEAGHFEEAIKFTQQAIDRVNTKHTNLIAELERRKILYQAHQPYHTAFVPEQHPVNKLLDNDPSVRR